MGRSKLAFDAAVLAAYAIAALPQLTGVPAHEWLSILAFAALAAHLCLSAGRLFPRRRKTCDGGSISDDDSAGQGGVVARRSGRSATGWGCFALDLLLALCLALCAVSGIMVSGDVLPALGLYASGYFFWDPLHAFSAKLLLAAVLVHLAVHLPMVLGVVRNRR